MRGYVRHPSDIPIHFRLEELVDEGDVDYLQNVSQGGLSFSSNRYIPAGSYIQLKIPLVKPVFQAIGRVSWCQAEGQHYHVGVEFLDSDDSFRARMVEQVCHIEHYKRQVLETEGRVLNGEQAAKEWIRRYAASFPKLMLDDEDQES